MKKIILFMIKSIQEYCCTFFCQRWADFSSLFWTKTSTKKLIFNIALLLFGLGFMPNSYAQLVGSSSVQANFGVEADAYANLLHFANLGGTPLPSDPNGIDDWFVSPEYPGSGIGVIDQTTLPLPPSPLPNNYSFERRQSRDRFSISDDGNYLWLDAIYGRDNNSAQGNKDATVFTSTSDKNPDNPITWNLGTGDVPQKDDIIDVMAHLRGTLPPANNKAYDVLWAFAAATLRSTDGDKHLDFEFFRTHVTYNTNDLHLGNTGDEGGRTAFTFANGIIEKAGTVIVSIDYQKGGSKPDVRIRVWLAEATFNSLVANPALAPFNVVAGSFEKGEQSGVYGYARILAKNENAAEPNIYGRVNLEGSTLAPPWGTLEGSNAEFFPEYQTLQHVEIGINLSAFGLDKRNTTVDPCSDILGSLLVKTRSCAGGSNDPFTCEQKDFAGPYNFGQSINPNVEPQALEPITCLTESTTTTLIGKVLTAFAGARIDFYGPASEENGGKGPKLTLTSLIPDANGLVSLDIPIPAVTGDYVFTAVASSINFPQCTFEKPVTLTVDLTPPTVTPSADNVSCNGGNDGSITLTFNGGTAPYKVNFNNTGYETQTSPKTYSGLVKGTYPWIVQGANGCVFEGSTDVGEPDAIEASATPTDPKCDDATDGSFSITASGGTGTLMYSKDDGATYQESNIFDGLVAGTYHWAVKDANECLHKGDVTLTDPPAITASATPTDPKCDDATDGSFSITASGGTGTLMYSKDDGATYQESNIFDGLVAGTYHWAVKDANECLHKGDVTLTDPPAITASATPTDPKCDDATDGSFSITASGGTGTLMYSKDDGATYQESNIFDGLVAGTYHWAVKDANNCWKKGEVTLTDPPAIVTSGIHKDVTCLDATDGSVTITFSGGTGTTYWVNFNGGGFMEQTSPKEYTGLGAGTYNWVVKDSNGCTQEGSVIIPVGISCGNGCTPGFWQGGKGKPLWDNINNDPIAMAVGFTTQTYVEAILPGVTGKCNIPSKLKMIDAITLGGGNCQKLMRHGVAAILNATTLATYPLPEGINSVQQLKDAIIAAVTNNCGCEPLATQLAANNELNHDLCGTITNEVINQLESNAKSINSTSENAVFIASPVPFKDQLTISYDYKYVTDVKIEIINSLGYVVVSNYDANGYLNKQVTLNIPYTGQAELYIVKVTTKGGSSTQKVLSSK